MSGMLDEWIQKRQAANERVLSHGTLITKRFFALDRQAYDEGKLPAKTKELMGLVASTVLRCNDCIAYHVLQAVKCGADQGEIVESLDVAWWSADRSPSRTCATRRECCRRSRSAEVSRPNGDAAGHIVSSCLSWRRAASVVPTRHDERSVVPSWRSCVGRFLTPCARFPRMA